MLSVQQLLDQKPKGIYSVAPTDPVAIVTGVFALGSVLFTIYALNVAHANDQARADEFLQVSGGLLIVYGIGNMVGPQLGGRLMDEMGPDGFFVAMGGVYALYGLYALWRSVRSRALPSRDMVVSRSWCSDRAPIRFRSVANGCSSSGGTSGGRGMRGQSSIMRATCVTLSRSQIRCCLRLLYTRV